MILELHDSIVVYSILKILNIAVYPGTIYENMPTYKEFIRNSEENVTPDF